MAVVAEKLTIKDTDEFDRFTVTGDRNAAGEGLYIATGDSVTAGSSITFAAGVNAIIEGVDLSAGTTGNSTIDATKVTTGTGMILVGGDGKNTIQGSAGVDSITGGDKVDSILGGNGADIIDGGKQADSIDGGAGADDITGGEGADIIILTDSAAEADELFFSSLTTNGIDVVTGFNPARTNFSWMHRYLP